MVSLIGFATLPYTLIAAAPYSATQMATWSNTDAINLQGMAVPNGAESVAWFEWGTNSSFGYATPAQAIGSGSAVVRVRHTLTGAAAQAPYWFRLAASNQFGLTYGRPQIACAGKMITAWGQNEYGATNVPAGLSNIVMTAGGSGHAVALRSDGTVTAWGANFDGQTNIPAGLGDLAAVSCGYRYNAALRREGTLVAWG